MKIKIITISLLLLFSSISAVSAASLLEQAATGVTQQATTTLNNTLQDVATGAQQQVNTAVQGGINSVVGDVMGNISATSPAPGSGSASSSTTQAGAGACGANQFCNPLGNVNTVSGVLSNVLNNLKGVIASIAIVFIVVGGFMYILSAGDEKMITKAKATIGGALIGLAIALAAPTFLKEIVTILSTGDGASADAAVAQAPTIKQIATRVLNFLLSIVGIIAMIGLVIGGASYLTAYGDEKKIETGKKIITNSMIGIAVAMIALVLVRQIAGLLGVQ